MKRIVSNACRVNPKAGAVNPKSAVFLVRAALMARGLSLAGWARAERVSRTQVSLALHRRRVDAKSRLLRAGLMKLIGGGR